MKIDARAVERFLTAPGDARAALLHGDNIGLARDRARALTVTVAGSVDDPFRITTLDRDTIGSLSEEMQSPPLNGGRRVIRLRDAGDFAASPIERALGGSGPAFIVIEAAALPARSKLRVVAEASPQCAVIACYAFESRQAKMHCRHALESADIVSDEETLEWLAAYLPSDHATIDQVLEKLRVYAGAEQRLGLDDVKAALAPPGAGSVEHALLGAFTGQVQVTDRAISDALADGVSVVQLVRACLGQAQRLCEARINMDQTGLRSSAGPMRPSVFRRSAELFSEAVDLWPAARLQALGTRLADLERQCKRTGAPDAILAHREFMRIALQARSLRAP